MVPKIISGGQTGADRAALDLAMELDIPYGGWLPKGRKAEDGPLPYSYNLKELSVGGYPKRTEQNVLDSDGTLILSHGKLAGGSKLTRILARRFGHALLHIDFNRVTLPEAVARIKEWIARENIKVLNVAGPRASEDKKIYQATKDVLRGIFL